jgi:hypothetical protein
MEETQYLQQQPVSEQGTLESLLHSEAKGLLYGTGVRVLPGTDGFEDIIHLFESTGLAGYDDSTQRIYIMPELVDSLIETIPKRSYLESAGRLSVPKGSLGGGGIAMNFEVGGEFVFEDQDSLIRDAMRSAHDAGLAFMFQPAGKPKDINHEIAQARLMYESFPKGHLFFRLTKEDSMAVAKEMYHDSGRVCSTHCPIIPPLTFNTTDRNYGILKECSEMGLPVYLGGKSDGKVNAPNSVYGTALAAYTDSLAAMLLASLLNPDNEKYNSFFSTVRLQRLKDRTEPAPGTAATNISNYLITRALAAYDIPAIQAGGLGNENALQEEEFPDAAYLGMKFLHLVPDVDMIKFAFGFKDDVATFDPDKMKRDMEIYRSIQDTSMIRRPELILPRGLHDPHAADAIHETITEYDGDFGRHWTNIRDLRTAYDAGYASLLGTDISVP